MLNQLLTSFITKHQEELEKVLGPNAVGANAVGPNANVLGCPWIKLPSSTKSK
jgi:hypothetical protein